MRLFATAAVAVVYTGWCRRLHASSRAVSDEPDAEKTSDLPLASLLLSPDRHESGWQVGPSGPGRRVAKQSLRFRSPAPLAEESEDDLLLSDGNENVSPELVARIDQEVRELTGLEDGLEGLLNPAKVVNDERNRLIKVAELKKCTDPDKRKKLEREIAILEDKLFIEKRTVFRGYLKTFFLASAVFFIIASGIVVRDYNFDFVYRVGSFWCFWIFVLPSLRARRPQGWEKSASTFAYFGTLIVSLLAPSFYKGVVGIWNANLFVLVASYAFFFLFARDSDGELGGDLPDWIKAIDWGSGQERGMTKERRAWMEKVQKEKEEKRAEKRRKRDAEVLGQTAPEEKETLGDQIGAASSEDKKIEEQKKLLEEQVKTES